MDALSLRAVAHELASRLTGRGVRRAGLIEPRELALVLDGAAEAPAENASPAMLVLAAWPGAPHVRLEPRSRLDRRLTDQLGELPALLAGAKILGIDTVGFERILHLTLAPRGEEDANAPLDLYFELVPRTPFVVLTGQGAIVSAMRAPGTSRPDDRAMSRGEPYLLPFGLGRPDRVPNAQMALQQLFAQSDQTPADLLAKRLRTAPQELSDLLAGARDPAAAAARLAEYRGPLAIERDRDGAPVIVPSAGGPSGSSAVQVVAEWARLHTEHARALRLHTLLGREIRAERGRVDRSLKATDSDALELGDAALLRRQGEILLVHLPEVEAGAHRIRLPDPYTGDAIEIELDPRRTAAANAEGYFQAARRAERAAAHLAARKRTAQKRSAALSAVESRLAALLPITDDVRLRALGELARELIAAGLVSADVIRSGAATKEDRERKSTPARAGGGATSARREARERLPYRAYPVSGGWEIWVGRSAADNDVLTHKLARPHDLWLHARGASGSHVVLRRIDGSRTASPPRAVIETAAAYAAYFSGAKKSRLVPVIVTEKRYVQKPRRSPPGTAVCLREKVVMAPPRRPAAATRPEDESPEVTAG